MIFPPSKFSPTNNILLDSKKVPYYSLNYCFANSIVHRFVPLPTNLSGDVKGQKSGNIKNIKLVKSNLLLF